jgi:hypothetical protein
MDYNTAIDAIAFARNNFDESISIGGGEPTLHPRFFDILRHCLTDFDYVWMATNGSKAKTMWRLASIIEDSDYENFPEDDYGAEIISNPHQTLCVALSTDHFHRATGTVDHRIAAHWKSNVERRNSGYETRDITQTRVGVIKQGRAVRTQVWQTENQCVCENIMIKPDGTLRLCGCTKSPVIGNIWNGIEDKWNQVISYDEGYRGCECYKKISGVDDEGKDYMANGYDEIEEDENAYELQQNGAQA